MTTLAPGGSLPLGVVLPTNSHTGVFGLSRPKRRSRSPGSPRTADARPSGGRERAPRDSVSASRLWCRYPLCRSGRGQLSRYRPKDLLRRISVRRARLARRAPWVRRRRAAISAAGHQGAEREKSTCRKPHGRHAEDATTGQPSRARRLPVGSERRTSEDAGPVIVLPPCTPTICSRWWRWRPPSCLCSKCRVRPFPVIALAASAIEVLRAFGILSLKVPVIGAALLFGGPMVGAASAAGSSPPARSR